MVIAGDPLNCPGKSGITDDEERVNEILGRGLENIVAEMLRLMENWLIVFLVIAE